MARKGKPWGPSNPLWRWQHRHKRRSGRRSSGRRSSGSRRPIRRAHAAPRRRFHMARRHRRRGGFKIPIISAAILAGQVLLAKDLAGGWNLNVLNYLGAQYSGYDFAGRGPRPELLIAG